MRYGKDLLTATLATIALAGAMDTAPGQEKEKTKKDRIEAVQGHEKEKIEDILRRLQKLEADVETLRGKLTVEDLQKATQVAAQSVCRIGNGSGFVLRVPPGSEGKKHDDKLTYILSAYHVLKSNDGTLLRSINYSSLHPDDLRDHLPMKDAQIAGESFEDDLIVFSIPKEKMPRVPAGLPLADPSASPQAMGMGSAAVMIGYPQNKFSSKVLFLSSPDTLWRLPAVKDGRNPLVRAVELAAGPWEGVRGHSGGPVILPEVTIRKGVRAVETPVAAMATATHTERHITAAVRAEQIREFLERSDILERKDRTKSTQAGKK